MVEIEKIDWEEMDLIKKEKVVEFQKGTCTLDYYHIEFYRADDGKIIRIRTANGGGDIYVVDIIPDDMPGFRKYMEGEE